MRDLIDRKRVPGGFEQINKKIKELSANIRPTLTTQAAAWRVVTTQAEAEADGASPTVTTWPGNLLGVPAVGGMKGSPRVAVVGGVPLPEFLGGLNFEVVNKDKAIAEQRQALTDQDQEMSEHIGTVVQAVRLVAPSSHFLFAETPSIGRGVVMESDLLKAIVQFTASKPDVLLIPLALKDSPIWSEVLGRLAKQSVVVVAGGNEGPTTKVQLDQTGLLEVLMSVAAVDTQGLPAHFSSTSEKAFWAPGVDIPLQIVVNKRLTSQIRNGTSYAAALAAGVAARILDEKKDLEPQRVIALLRATSQPVSPKGPPVLNLAAALKKLQGL